MATAKHIRVQLRVTHSENLLPGDTRALIALELPPSHSKCTPPFPFYLPLMLGSGPYTRASDSVMIWRSPVLPDALLFGHGLDPRFRYALTPTLSIPCIPSMPSSACRQTN